MAVDDVARPLRIARPRKRLAPQAIEEEAQESEPLPGKLRKQQQPKGDRIARFLLDVASREWRVIHRRRGNICNSKTSRQEICKGVVFSAIWNGAPRPSRSSNTLGIVQADLRSATLLSRPRPPNVAISNHSGISSLIKSGASFESPPGYQETGV